MCMFCRSLFVLLYFFFWPLCCLSVYDLRLLITSSESYQTLFYCLMSLNSQFLCKPGYPEHLSSSPVFSGVPCYSIFSFMCMFCRSLFVFLYFFFWPFCCLFFFDIRILITPLVSSNSSYFGHLRNVELSFITNYDICIVCRYLSIK